jgi:hypothetical protein
VSDELHRYYLNYTAMNTKSWTQSKTILFNLAIAILTVLTSESDTLRGLLSDRGYVVLMLFVAIGNTTLRMKTDTAIARPANKGG